MADLSRSYLVNGYISHTFGRQGAEYYMSILFKVDARTVVACAQNGTFYVFNQPSRYCQPNASINGRMAWILDYVIKFGAGSVVPQQFRIPQRIGGRIHNVDQANFRLPVFLFNMENGSGHRSLGVSVKDAAMRQMQLFGGHYPQPFSENSEIKIRITWPGYDTIERRVGVRDWTPQKNYVTLERVIRAVGRHVRQYLSHCEQIPIPPFFNWRVGHGNISPDEVILIGLIQVPEGRWMPILQLMSRIVLSTT